jgi:anaerobic selenocysteine-containing dehydrogenase
MRLPIAAAPFAEGGFPTPSGKCELRSEWLAGQGVDALPAWVPPHESPPSAPELARDYPLAFISPPSRNFLNSSFANLPRFRGEAGEPRLEMHPADASPRGIADGDGVRIFNARGAFLARARVGDYVRCGVVSAPSIWWQKLSGDGQNANAVTSEALTDMGGGATFYDCLVEVARVQPD